MITFSIGVNFECLPAVFAGLLATISASEFGACPNTGGMSVEDGEEGEAPCTLIVVLLGLRIDLPLCLR